MRMLRVFFLCFYAFFICFIGFMCFLQFVYFLCTFRLVFRLLSEGSVVVGIGFQVFGVVVVGGAQMDAVVEFGDFYRFLLLVGGLVEFVQKVVAFVVFVQLFGIFLERRYTLAWLLLVRRFVVYIICIESGFVINQFAIKMYGIYGGQMDILGRVDMFKVNDIC